MKEPELIPTYLHRLFADVAVPKWLVAIGVGLANYALPNVAPSMFIATGCLVLVDTLSGMVAAKWQGEPITSARFSRFLVKSFAYAVSIGALALIVRVIPVAQSLHSAAVIAMLTGIAGTEFISILENLKKLGYTYPKWLEQAVRAGIERAGKQAPAGDK